MFIPVSVVSGVELHAKSAIEIMQLRASDLVRELLESVPAGSVRAAFAGGSVGRGEVWAEVAGDTQSIYSDLDLYVVLAEGADERAVRRAAATIAASLVPEAKGVVFHRGADVGVYRLEDLCDQPRRPGTVDLVEHHHWLYGDRAVLDALAKREAESGAIEPGEALYLLENRAWDALEARAEIESAPARARVTSAKVILDVGAAHLIAEGRFRPTLAARLASLQERTPQGMSDRAQQAIAWAVRVREGDAAARVDAAGAQALVAEAWCTLARLLLAPNASASDLLAIRCRRGALVSNMREFVRLRRRWAAATATASLGAWRFAHLSPVAALRTHALVRALTESGMATASAVAFHTEYVDRLVASRDGGLDARARAAWRALS